MLGITGVQSGLVMPEHRHPLGECIADQDDLVTGIDRERGVRRSGDGQGEEESPIAEEKSEQLHGDDSSIPVSRAQASACRTFDSGNWHR